MEKYKFVKKSIDDYELHYFKGKEEKIIPFRHTINLTTILEKINVEARFKMYEWMTANKKTKQDLIIETKTDDGKIIVDESNYIQFENEFLNQSKNEAIMKVYQELFKMPMDKLMQELNLTEEEAYNFGAELGNILNKSDDKFPC